MQVVLNVLLRVWRKKRRGLWRARVFHDHTTYRIGTHIYAQWNSEQNIIYIVFVWLLSPPRARDGEFFVDPSCGCARSQNACVPESVPRKWPALPSMREYNICFRGKVILNARTSNVCGAHQHIQQTAVVPIVSVTISFFLFFWFFYLDLIIGIKPFSWMSASLFVLAMTVRPMFSIKSW